MPWDHITVPSGIELRSHVQLWGSVEARFSVQDLSDPDIPPRLWSGEVDFHWPVTLSFVDARIKEYLETNCFGGYSFRKE